MNGSRQRCAIDAFVGGLAPAALLDVTYGAFARRRYAWYGKVAGRAAPPRTPVVDAEAQATLVAKEVAVAAGFVVAWLSCVTLPASDLLKDGPIHAFARLSCAVFCVAAVRAWAPRGGKDAFFHAFVGRADAASLAVLRAACALVPAS